MSRTPSEAEREQSLERLADAYASGRITHAEFAERSDKVLSTRSISVLDSLLADLNAPQASSIYGMAPRSYDPQPARRPVQGPPRFDRRTGLGIALFAAGAASVVFIALGARVSEPGPVPADPEYPSDYPSGPVEPPFEAATYLDPVAIQMMFDRLWTSVISSIVFTPAQAVAVFKPRGEAWQQLSMSDGGERLSATEPGTNVFDLEEVNVNAVAEALHATPDALGTARPVSELEVTRTNAADPVRVKVTVNGVGHVVWDAQHPVVIEVMRG